MLTHGGTIAQMQAGAEIRELSYSAFLAHIQHASPVGTIAAKGNVNKSVLSDLEKRRCNVYICTDKVTSFSQCLCFVSEDSDIVQLAEYAHISLVEMCAFVSRLTKNKFLWLRPGHQPFIVHKPA